MTTIDQAFIRAYLQQTARDVPKCDVAPEAAAEDRAEPAQADRPEKPLEPLAELVTSSMVEPMHTSVTTLVTESLSAPVVPTEPERKTAPAPKPVAKVEPPAPKPAPKVEPPAVQAAPEVEPPPRPAEVAPPVAEEKPDEKPAETAFQPMLQVDGFAWSDRATSLRLAAGIQVDRLADALSSGIAEGRNVTAIAGSGRHQGCTTMLLCVGKRLADRGLKVALVDADFAHPALAANLGLLPEEGFEAVLGGRASLEDVAIESVGDEMTVLPVAAPAAAAAESADGQAAQAAAIDVLRRCYDLVLVDVGEVSGPSAAGSRGGRSVPRWIDAFVLIQDVRSTGQAEVAEILGRAENDGVTSLGVVENFV